MKEIIMPKLSDTMIDGIIADWYKNEGNPIERGEILFAVETEKATNEIPSSHTGTVGKLFAEVNDTVEVLKVIGFILEPGEKAPDEWPVPGSINKEEFKLGQDWSLSNQQSKSIPAAKPVSAGMRGGGDGEKPNKVKISPRAKRMIEELGLSTAAITGSGPDGKIMADDVAAFIESENKPRLSKTKLITAKRMTDSFTSTPHFSLVIEPETDKLVAYRDKLLPEIEKSTGLRLTISDLIIFLVSRVIINHPLFNASWQDGTILENKSPNIGLAIATDSGLLVPVFKSANSKDLKTLVGERSRLVEKAKAGRLSSDDLDGGTFTITNLGMFGVDSFSAIINPPQSAILAVGQIREKLALVNNKVNNKTYCSITLTIDHRVMDGADGARFLADLRQAIESPAQFPLE